jgi:AcrR family transcriptional regulator
MGKRELAVEETKRRIVEAIFACHAEKGVLATSYEDIARKADVALATVYRHFPTLNDLVVACGGLVVEQTHPPNESIFDGLDDNEERVAALIREVFAFYERGGPVLDAAHRDAAAVPALAAFINENDLHFARLARLALPDAPEADVTLLRALTDFHVWKGLNAKGLGPVAASLVTDMFLSRIHNPAAAPK